MLSKGFRKFLKIFSIFTFPFTLPRFPEGPTRYFARKDCQKSFEKIFLARVELDGRGDVNSKLAFTPFSKGFPAENGFSKLQKVHFRLKTSSRELKENVSGRKSISGTPKSSFPRENGFFELQKSRFRLESFPGKFVESDSSRNWFSWRYKVGC